MQCEETGVLFLIYPHTYLFLSPLHGSQITYLQLRLLLQLQIPPMFLHLGIP